MGFLDGLLNDMVRESTGYDPKMLRKLKKNKKLKKVTRLVGKKNLLLLGAGAAVAGGVAASQGGFGGALSDPTNGPSTWAAPTGPPPETPSAAPPAHTAPPPPPVPVPVPGALAGPAGADTGAAPKPPLPPIPGAPPPAAPSAPSASPDAPVLDAGAASAVLVEDGEETEEMAVSPELAFAIVRAMVAAALADGHLDEHEKQLIHGRLDDSGLGADRIQQVHRDLVIPPTPAELAGSSTEVAELEAMYRFASAVILVDEKVSDLERSWLDRLATAFGFEGGRKAELEAEIFEG